MRLVVDSASDIRELEGIDYAVVPLSIRTESEEFRDDANLDVMGMVASLEETKEKSGSACPGIGEFTSAFGKEKEVIVVTVAEALSGCYNSALTAAGLYMEENADTEVFVLDSKSIGPVEKLIAQKVIELNKQEMTNEEIYDEVCKYNKNNAKIAFVLKKLNNLANNGRISPAVAKIANALGIRVVGDFSEAGFLQVRDKIRGEKKALEALVANMKKEGYNGKKVIIDHCDGLSTALLLKYIIEKSFPDAPIYIEPTTGICSFYAERGGIVVGYEV